MPTRSRKDQIDLKQSSQSFVDIENFTEEKECDFKGEHYSVRNNGAVFRHQRIGKRLRPNDCKWTFGKENSSNPYLMLSNIPFAPNMRLALLAV
ncbi:MAG: hypothetical protein OEQ24_10290 [Gammaproteobacteria bacterium]|nr:hypothetical protein [Gammaproteobacteria bacterium]